MRDTRCTKRLCPCLAGKGSQGHSIGHSMRRFHGRRQIAPHEHDIPRQTRGNTMPSRVESALTAASLELGVEAVVASPEFRDPLLQPVCLCDWSIASRLLPGQVAKQLPPRASRTHATVRLRRTRAGARVRLIRTSSTLTKMVGDNNIPIERRECRDQPVSIAAASGASGYRCASITRTCSNH
jgi:hypothetical protein